MTTACQHNCPALSTLHLSLPIATETFYLGVAEAAGNSCSGQVFFMSDIFLQHIYDAELEGSLPLL